MRSKELKLDESLNEGGWQAGCQAGRQAGSSTSDGVRCAESQILSLPLPAALPPYLPCLPVPLYSLSLSLCLSLCLSLSDDTVQRYLLCVTCVSLSRRAGAFIPCEVADEVQGFLLALDGDGEIFPLRYLSTR